MKQECSQAKVFVLPAFETAPLPDTEQAHALAREAASVDKAGLLKMVEKGQLWQFALKLFKAVSCAVSTAGVPLQGCNLVRLKTVS